MSRSFNQWELPGAGTSRNKSFPEKSPGPQPPPWAGGKAQEVGGTQPEPPLHISDLMANGAILEARTAP